MFVAFILFPFVLQLQNYIKISTLEKTLILFCYKL